ncbi:MAG: CopD family protein [Anaerolineales bacterium]|nr:CopD family protein [Anaerolineales bacterium]
MPTRQIVFALVTFLHDLFTAVWIGGLITLGITVLPSARKVLGASPQTKQLMAVIQKRLSALVYVSIVVLVVTGVLQANRNPAFLGLFSFGNLYSTVLTLKHILVLAMTAVALIRSLALGRQNGPSTPAREKQSAGLLFINIALGILVLLLSGFTVALSSGIPPA